MNAHWANVATRAIPKRQIRAEFTIGGRKVKFWGVVNERKKRRELRGEREKRETIRERGKR